MDITFESLPQAVKELHAKFDRFEKRFSNPTQSGPDKFLNVDEAAKFLELSKATIYSKVNRGELTYIKRGKKLLFLQSDLTEYLMSGRREARK